MFGSLGFTEIAFILVLALLLFGPKRLPEIGRTIGKGMAEFRRASNDLRRTLEQEVALDEAATPKPPSVGPIPAPALTAAPPVTPADADRRAAAALPEGAAPRPETAAAEAPERSVPRDG